jgi:signal transduction histidine kinase
MCREVTLTYGWSDPRLPAGARAFCGGQLATMLPAGAVIDTVVDTAELIFSELVTNAINAGTSALELTLAIHRDHLRLAVRDDARGRPQRQDAAPTDSHGRGLEIVAALSRAWGVDRSPPGKQVWAQLPIAVELVQGIPCILDPISTNLG